VPVTKSKIPSLLKSTDAKLTPPQGVGGVLANRLGPAGPPNFVAQGQSVSRKTVAEVPLTGLSLAIA